MRRLIAALLLATPAAVALAQGKFVRMSSAEARHAADTATGFRLVLSIGQRRIWAIDSTGDTLRAARCAVGSGTSLSGASRSWYFNTPRGVAEVTAKEVKPVWVPPDWHYVEMARDSGLRVSRLDYGVEKQLRDGRALVVRGNRVGIVGRDSTFEPLPLDEEVVFDRTLFIPPLGTLNRRVEGALGPYRLLLSNGIGIHGTPYKESIGHAVTHGCVRLLDDDIAWLYDRIPVGTRVIIY